MRYGRLAQLVERTLSMREVEGSKPSMSTFFMLFLQKMSCKNQIWIFQPASRSLFLKTAFEPFLQALLPSILDFLTSILRNNIYFGKELGIFFPLPVHYSAYHVNLLAQCTLL